MPQYPKEQLLLNEKIDIKMRVKPSHAILKTMIHRYRNLASEEWSQWTIVNSSLLTQETLNDISEILCTQTRKDQEIVQI